MPTPTRSSMAGRVLEAAAHDLHRARGAGRDGRAQRDDRREARLDDEDAAARGDGAAGVTRRCSKSSAGWLVAVPTLELPALFAVLPTRSSRSSRSLKSSSRNALEPRVARVRGCEIDGCEQSTIERRLASENLAVTCNTSLTDPPGRRSSANLFRDVRSAWNPLETLSLRGLHGQARSRFCLRAEASVLERQGRTSAFGCAVA